MAIRRRPMQSRAFRCMRHRSIRARDTQMLARVLRTVACSDTRPTITELDHDRIELDARLTNHLEGLCKESAVVRVYVDLKQRHVLTVQKPAQPPRRRRPPRAVRGTQRYLEALRGHLRGTQSPSQESISRGHLRGERRVSHLPNPSVGARHEPAARSSAVPIEHGLYTPYGPPLNAREPPATSWTSLTTAAWVTCHSSERKGAN